MPLALYRNLLRSSMSCLRRVQGSKSLSKNQNSAGLSTWLIRSQKPGLLQHQSSRTMVGWLRPCSGSIKMTNSKTCAWNTCCSAHTKHNKNLLEFLNEEIKLETESQKKPPSIKDFSITAEESEVTLTKTVAGEQIKINFNINHSVNSAEMTEEENDDSQMVCKPPFTIEISKDGQTLSLSCAFTEDIADPSSGEQYADTLEIEEVSLYKNEWSDRTYTVSSSVMDGNLYDHLLNLLEDRGIDEEFVEQLIDFATIYEHGQYINFLKGLKNFVK